MPPHPKPAARAKKPGAMKTKPKGHGAVTPQERASIAARKAPKELKVTAKMPEEAAGGKTVKLAPETHAKIAKVAGATKGAMILNMLKTPGGATSKEMEAATGWQPHSVRGYLGTLRKSGVVVISKKLPKEPTIYRVEAAAPESTGEVL